MTGFNHWNPLNAKWCDIDSWAIVSVSFVVSVKRLSVCVSVRAKGLEEVDVCLLSKEVCNSVWQWVIDSESQSQTLLRKHKVCMPGHIPVCLFIWHSGLLWIGTILQSRRLKTNSYAQIIFVTFKWFEMLHTLIIISFITAMSILSLLILFCQNSVTVH